MEYINMVTLVIMMILGSGIAVGLFSVYFFQNADSDSRIKVFIASKLLMLGASIIVLATASSLGRAAMISNTTLSFISVALEVYCFMSLTRKFSRQEIRNGLILLSVAIALYSFFSGSVFLRVLVNGSYYFIMFSLLFAVSIFKKRNSVMQVIVGVFAGLFAIANLIRMAYNIYSYGDVELLSTGMVQVIAGIIWICMAFVFPILFLFLLKEEDNKKLKEANAMKDKFFSIMAHDLKTPITTFGGSMSFIYEHFDNLDDKQLKSFFETLNDSSKHLLDLIENLLTWSRFQIDSIGYNPEKVTPEEIIRHNLSMLSLSASAKKINLFSKPGKNLSVFADLNMFNTVLRNLITNAIKFTPEEGEIEVSYSENPSNNFVRIEVSDTGVGIPKEQIDTLFKIDSNVSTLGTKNEIGTGLGLILCKDFVEKHGGEIGVESEEGKGSTFYFTLPVMSE
jgi:two-component system, sensor histidine kinase and response regulator